MRHTTWSYRLNFLLLFCLAVFCWALSRSAYTELQKQPSTTTFQNVGGLLATDYEPMLRSEAQASVPLTFTLWTQTDNQLLEGHGTGQTQNVSWLSVKGDTQMFFPLVQTLSEEDTSGCLIDKTTAEKLFLSDNAVGNIIKMGGNEYTVRGVIDSPDRTIVTQLARENSHNLSHITVYGTDNIDTFLMRHGFSTAVTIKTSQYIAIARIFYMLPVMTTILVGIMFLCLLRQHWRAYRVRQLLVSIGILGVGTMSFLLLFSFIPEMLIPSRWSDFEFWGTAGRDFMQMATEFIVSAKYRPDLNWLYGVFHSAFGVLSAHFILRLYSKFRLQLRIFDNDLVEGDIFVQPSMSIHN